jgi:pyruvate dehydrogenase E2 component (dihydrolipoamide acetyltransferase)
LSDGPQFIILTIPVGLWDGRDARVCFGVRAASESEGFHRMTVEFELPNLGEGVESADVAEVLVAEGDVVQVDQPVLELETEKAVMEVPCPHAGVIRRVHVTEGETIRVGQVLLTIETDTTAPAAAGETTPAEPASAAAQSGNGSPSTAAKKAPAAAASPRPGQSSRGEPTESSAAGDQSSHAGERVVQFTLPNLGEGVTSADVADVLVKVGDVIQADQPVLELETEKAVMEVPCPHAGRIEEVRVQPGDKVESGQVVLTVRTSGAAAAAPEAPARTEAPRQAASTVSPSASPRSSASRPSPAPAPAPETVTIARATETDGSAPPIPAAPSTRRLARKLGVDLRAVRGSGPGGRITQEDVQEYVRGQLSRRQLPAVVRPTGGVAVGGALAPPPLPDFSRFGVIEREPLNKIARTAAENLTVSWNVIPHVTQHDRADITELEAARKRFTQGVGKNGPKVTMTAIAIKALTTCLQAFPKFNSSLDPETNELVLKRYYHIGCAVDTPHGLLVPVVKDCDKKSILEIAAVISELAEKARQRKLSMEDMQGATCTVTNLGGIGGTAFTPIVNYPEVCILGMARTQTELQLVGGQVQERLLLPLALSYDHRVINGADAARFVATLCQMLADPFQLLSAI